MNQPGLRHIELGPVEAVIQQPLSATWKHRFPFFATKPKLVGDEFGGNANTLFPLRGQPKNWKH
jgi:hypothetical protein